jgi:translation initiation factor 2 beta subunit (eIF-2beta)/eIF-5
VINVDWAKAIIFAKNNWKGILIIVSLALVSIKTRMDYNALNRAYEISQAELNLQIISLRDIHAEELRQRDQAVETYRETLRQIEQNYLDSQEQLSRTREEKTENYVRQFSQDQEGLASEIIDAYGFEHVE